MQACRYQTKSPWVPRRVEKAYPGRSEHKGATQTNRESQINFWYRVDICQADVVKESRILSEHFVGQRMIAWSLASTERCCTKISSTRAPLLQTLNTFHSYLGELLLSSNKSEHVEEKVSVIEASKHQQICNVYLLVRWCPMIGLHRLESVMQRNHNQQWPDEPCLESLVSTHP